VVSQVYSLCVECLTLLMIFQLIIKNKKKIKKEEEKKELVTPLSAQRRSFHNDKTT